MPKLLRALSALAAASLLLTTGCSRQFRAARAVARGTRYYDAGQYDAAEIEYLSAMRTNGPNAEAIAHLAMIYFDQGRVGASFPYLTAARQLEPDNLDVRVKYGLFVLSYGEFQKARDEANFILDHQPSNRDAPLLLVQAAVQPKDIAAARERLGKLPAPIAASAPVLVALGTLDFRQHLLPQAEAEFRRALAADPKSGAAYTALGALYWEKKDLADADQAFAQAANLAAERSQKRLQYAQFKIVSGDAKAGRSILEDVVRKAPDYLPAALQLAELDESEKRFDDGEAAISHILSRDPSYPEALLLSGRLMLGKGEPQRAVSELERAQKFYPNYPQIGYELAQAYLAVGAVEKATFSLTEAIARAPEFSEAVMLLAQVNMQKGDMASATLTLRQLIEKRPDFPQARLVLAQAYLAQNDPADAIDVYQQFTKAFPNDPNPYLLAGIVLMREGRLADARRDLEHALVMAPAFLPAVEQLVALDLAQNQSAAARQLVENQLAKKKGLPELYVMLGRILIVQGDPTQAEAVIKKAIELQPDFGKAYYLLAQYYFSTHQEQKAVADLTQEVAKNPRDTQALMLLATIQGAEKHYPEARVAYEKLLAIDPNFSSALNDLAYLYEENFGLVDKALELAQRARKLLPDEPHVADTLGWILYKKGQYQWALGFLQESSSKLPDEPESLYHLAMTQYMLGQVEAARSSFEHALASKNAFAEIDEVRRRVAELQIDVEHAGPAERAILEKAAADRPSDSVVLARLAAVYEHAGDTAKAVKFCDQALKNNPDNVPALVLSARVDLNRGDIASAFDRAKSARNLAPNDPEIAYLTGRLAYRTGDYPWAVTLIGQAAGSQPNDAELQYDLALATYTQGQVPDAESAARRALQIKADFSRAAEDEHFLQLVELSNDPKEALAHDGEVEQYLTKQPDDVPALMAHGIASQQRGDVNAARQAFEKVLTRYPDFFPARRPLTILYSQLPTVSLGIIDVATKAREAYPNDPEVARACGIIAYRDGNFQRCETLLKESQESSSAVPADAELMFYLGMSQYHLKESSSKANLQQALELNLTTDQAAEAKRAVAALK